MSSAVTSGLIGINIYMAFVKHITNELWLLRRVWDNNHSVSPNGDWWHTALSK